jgi:hypothetical protein
MTMQKLLLSGSDVFYELNDMRTDDLGVTWSGPTPHPTTLGRRTQPGGIEVVICDATPRWHASSGKLLSTGHSCLYRNDDAPMPPGGRTTVFTVYDPQNRTWSPWSSLAMPDMENRFFDSGAGCTQRFDLENGDILLPIYFQPRKGGPADSHISTLATVCRCRFDGTTLRYVEHGTELFHPKPRGFNEPSLTRFRGRFFLTLRNDQRGFVTAGDNGLHYEPPRPWTFDDGSELGNYNTQQHWVTHGDGLFLVYTRRGLNNDHVFRNRAPLVMAQVDPDRLCVWRDSERVIVPERGARLGNFAVTEISEQETWVTVSEWMQNSEPWARVMMKKLGRCASDSDPIPPSSNYYARECECFGSENAIWVSRLQWEKPNTVPYWMRAV